MTVWLLFALFGAGYLAHAVKTWLRKVGTPGLMPGWSGRNLSSF
jgi:hypothetical protein